MRSLTNSIYCCSPGSEMTERNLNPRLVWVGRLDFKAFGLRGMSDFQGSQCVLVWIDLQKRVCRLLGTAAGEAGAQLVGCAMDQDSRQKLLPDSAPWAAKTKQNSVILENHGSKGISQPCPRCVAGESGHFSHILGF
ncbi:uncharacterized protein C10orf143 homolog [Pyrgilauda ruficollis]|uniref:uncharacterized protein C10orf143 homolog n=1 Tax=Pyrgilauda ruficollis TaxID=221976 RepID=UPI001B86D7FD|nr:uncharacterized protein C10orf143 homolog [Pyrgilauda ruficollis]